METFWDLDNMKNINKAQVTTFIIIAILIVVAVILIIVLIRNSSHMNNNSDKDYISISDCLKRTSEQAIYYIGGTGGYYYIPLESTDYGIAYYFYDKKSIMLTKEKLEQEIGYYIEDMGKSCNINDDNKQVTYGNISSIVQIKDNEVLLNINYPVIIESSSKTVSYDKFDISVPGRIGLIYNAAREYIINQTVNPDGICIDCINNIANKYDVKFITYDFDNSTVIFNIYDNNTKINTQDYYVYSFAVKYDINYSEMDELLL